MASFMSNTPQVITSVKQVGNRALVTELFKTDALEVGHTIEFNYYGNIRREVITKIRPLTTNNSLLIFTPNYCVDSEQDDVYRVVTRVLDWNACVLGSLVSAGLMTIEEALEEFTTV